MLRTKIKYENKQKIKYENKQRVITKRLSTQELWFLCTTLHLNEIYPATKFHNHSKYFWRYALDKIQV